MEIDFAPLPAPRAAYSSVSPRAEVAVLFLHGITGSPAAWHPIARALAADDLSVSVPLLPGHGASWQDLAATSWSDWFAAAEAELRSLQADHERVVVAGLSMGGALSLALGTLPNPPDKIVVVNPALFVDSPLTPLLPVLSRIVPTVKGIGNDIAHPGRDEYAGDRTPVAAVASLASALRGLRTDLWEISSPVTVLVSGQDAVVGPRSLRVLRSRLRESPEIIALRRSRHVATLDFDAEIIAEAVAAAAFPGAGRTASAGTGPTTSAGTGPTASAGMEGNRPAPGIADE